MLKTAAARGRFEQEVWLRRGDGSQLRADIAIASLVGRGRDLGFLVGIWNAAAPQRPQDQVQGAVEISQAILAGQELEEVLHLIVSRARSLLRAEAVWVVLAPREGEATGDGEGPGPVAVARCVGSVAYKPTGGDLFPVVIPDIAEAAWREDPVRHLPKLTPVLGVTLAAEGRALGTLFVANRRGERPFVKQDLEPLQLFADQAALAIRLVDARRDRERVAAWERERLARDLHDGTVQSLYAVTLGLTSASARTGDLELREQLEGLARTVQTAIEDLGNYIFELGPSLLAGRRLDEAVLQLVSDFQLRSGLVTKADVDPAAGQRLDGQASEMIQIIREALSNIRRHAKAESCKVSLRLNDEGAHLRVEDDGVGFDPARPPLGRNGLRNLRERVARLGGHLEIESAANAGSAVAIEIPLVAAGGGT